MSIPSRTCFRAGIPAFATHPRVAFQLALLAFLAGLSSPGVLWAQEAPPRLPPELAQPNRLMTTEDWNQRLQQLARAGVMAQALEEYRLGPDDLLDITVFEAPELNRTVRVSAGGEISLPLLGAARAAGLTPRELESVLQELLRRTYMKDPHVGVFVREVESHPVSVFGAVKKPGVFQVRGSKTLLEVLSLAGGLAEDAGDTVIVMPQASWARPPSPSDPRSQSAGQAEAPVMVSPALAEPVEINLKELLESADPRANVLVHPGDIVKVTRAGIVYVVGEVKKPGGFLLKSNENISVLQAIALAEGLTRTAAKSQARIIRADPQTGQRREVNLDLGRILAGKAADPLLLPKDIVFVPNSGAKSALYRGAETALSIVSGVIIWRR